MEELIIEGKTYISSKRAAEITGYAKDYVGQLCREGRVKARLVGRSWYVLEDSIRAHRFGEEEEEAVQSAPKAPEPEAWSAPRYVHEEAPEMPSLKERTQASPDHSPEVKSEALSDMQEAWQEWFNQKQEEILEVVEDELEDVKIEKEAPTEEEQVSIKTPWSDLENVVTLHRSHSSMPFSEPVQQTETSVSYVRPSRRHQPEMVVPTGSNRVLKAVIVAVSLFVLLATVIGTGVADSYMDENIADNPVFNFLGGKSTVNK